MVDTKLEAEELTTEQDPQVKCGYFIGLKEDGDFVFEILGDQVGIVELLGLHKFAEHKLMKPIQDKENQKVEKMLQTIISLLTHPVNPPNTP
jgi:hypothetical protein